MLRASCLRFSIEQDALLISASSSVGCSGNWFAGQSARLTCAVVGAILICFAGPVRAGSVAEKLFPVETDVIVTLNPREILRDYRENPSVQRYLDQWRLAAKGDRKQLTEYYESQEVQRYEGITPKEFLERSSMITAVCEAFGNDPFEDVDLITVGYRAGNPGFLAVIAEGRFQQRGTDQLEQFFQQHVFPVNQIDGPSLGMLDSNTFVYADCRKTLEFLRARAPESKSDLPAGVRTLLTSVQSKHLSVVINGLEVNLERLIKFLGDELTGYIGIDPEISKSVVAQLSDWNRKHATDYAAASFGMSVRDTERWLELGLNAKSVEKAELLQTQIVVGGYLVHQALKTIDLDLARAVGGILSRQRVVLKDTTLMVQIDLPHAVVRQAFDHPLLDLFPDSSKANANTKPASGQKEIHQTSWRVTSLPLWKSGVSTADITEVRDEPYRSGPGTDSFRHRLDMFLPRDQQNFPVVVLVHGGGWDEGDNRCAGLYSSVGQFLASQGIGAVLPNYRLSPGVKHPEHVKDVASAMAWTRSHIGKYGGDARRLYLLGHSAGGHLVSLLAADESYLQGEGMSSADIKGVITFSGVYRISEGTVCGVLLGAGPRALRIEQQIPFRGESSPTWKWMPPGWHVRSNPFGTAFGESSEQRAAASPIAHVRRDMPPFLILSPEHDLPLLGPMAEEFHAALREKDCDARLLLIPRRNHNSLMFSVITTQDPAAQAVLEFVKK